MTTKKRSVLLSVLMLLLSIALLASGTYALFTDEVDLSNHLQAGKMDVTLKRTCLEKLSLDDKTGYLVDWIEPDDAEDVDFSNPTTRNVFDLTSVDRIVPGCKYTATMQITNDEKKSDVAFGYWIEIKLKGTDKVALADQLEITVLTGYNGPDGESKFIAEGLTVGSEAKPIAIITRGKSDEFKVSVEFRDLKTNNSAMSNNLEFDLVVHAVQVTKDPALSGTTAP